MTLSSRCSGRSWTRYRSTNVTVPISRDRSSGPRHPSRPLRDVAADLVGEFPEACDDFGVPGREVGRLAEVVVEVVEPGRVEEVEFPRPRADGFERPRVEPVERIERLARRPRALL